MERDSGEIGKKPRRGAGRRRLPGGLWLLLGLGLGAGLWFWLAGGGMEGGGLGGVSPDELWRRLLRPLGRTLVFVSAGLLVGQLLEGLGLSARLGVLARPLMRLAHLPPEAGTAFTAAFASGVAANTLLFTSWREGRLDNRQLILANILNASLPAYFLHLPTTFFVVYALLGRAALYYFGLTLLAALLRCAGVVLASRWWLPPGGEAAAAGARPRPPWPELWADTRRKFLTRLRRLLLIVVPVYLVVFWLSHSGFFDWLGRRAAGLVSESVLPVKAMSVVVFSVVAEFTSGFAAAGALLQSGGLGLKQVVMALLIGNLVATPVRALRHQVPHYMGIYSPKTGVKLLAIGQAVRVASVLVVLLLYAWMG